MPPDVMVVCGDREPGANATDTPVVLFEALSAGTESRDRFEKWGVYQRLDALRHDGLVARDRPHPEVFDRIDGIGSGVRVRDGLDATLGFSGDRRGAVTRRVRPARGCDLMGSNPPPVTPGLAVRREPGMTIRR